MQLQTEINELENDITEKFEKLREHVSSYNLSIINLEKNTSDNTSNLAKNFVKFKIIQEEIKVLQNVT